MSFGEYAKNDSLNVEYGIQNATNLEIVITKAEQDLIVYNTTTNGTEDRYISHVIDLKSFIENLNDTDIDIEAESFDYFGQYIVRINDTQAGCLLEQFEIEVAKWLDPNNNDTDGDGIMDGVETGALVRGIDTIDFKDIYWYEERNYAEPQGWWTLDDETKGAGVAEDWSGNEYHGDLTNMWYENWVPGKIGPYALFFDGTNEYVNFDAILEGASTGAFGDNSQEFTITAWINATDISNAAQSNHGTKNCFIAKAGASTNDNFELGVNNDGKIHVYLDTESHDTSANLGTADDVLEGTWTFIAVRYNYGNLTLSIDNKTYESTAWQGGSTDLDAAIGANFTIGRTMDSNVFFEGSIDDVRVYNTRLNDNNIEWIYNNGSAQSLKPVSSGAPLTTGNGSDTYDEFQLEIPYIGEVFDANLTLKIESEETPWGNYSTIGTIEVELIKDELNCSVEDATLIDTSHYIYDGWDFSKQHNLELSEYLANGSISEYYGTYILRIEVTDANFSQNYNFTLSEFSIETDTWIQADGLEDSKGWITDPAKWDTDDDGWGDYYEIYSRETNPCSVDTDGDGAWDPNDRDPKRDLLIQIKFINGKYNHLEMKHTPRLQGVVEFEVLNQEFYFTTESVRASTSENEFDIPRRAWFGHKYYFNVEDDKTILGNWINLDFELWWMGEDGDTKLLADDYDYTIGTAGNNIEKEFENGFGNKLLVQMDTFATEKCNTIAIYEANSTFNGHYLEQERMNVIQLHITDTGGAFKAGPNAIVIPTSLFTNTKLNSYIQNQQIEQTPLYSPDENFQFISVDRDKGANSDGATSKVDFVIIRKGISSSQAMEVLDLLTIGFVNESLDENNMTIYEEAKIYSYVSTEINGTKAVDMNLAPEVMKYIPWFNIYVNSPQGREPIKKSKVASPTKILLNLCKDISKGDIIGAFTNAFSSIMVYFNLDLLMEQILAVIKAVIDFLVMVVLTILGPLLWLIIRAILFVLIWIMFAIMLAMVLMIFVTVFAIVLLISSFINIQLTTSINKVEIGGEFYFKFEYNTGEIYNDFIDTKIPKLSINIDSVDFGFELISSFFSNKFIVTKFPLDLLNKIEGDEGEQSSSEQSSKPKTSGEPESVTNLWDFFIGMCDGFALASFLYGGIAIGEELKKGELIAFGVGAAIFIPGLIYFWLTLQQEPDNNNKARILAGWALGLIIITVIAVAIEGKDSHISLDFIGKWVVAYVTSWDAFLGVVGLMLDLGEYYNKAITNSDSNKILDRTLGIVGGIFGFGLAITAFLTLEKKLLRWGCIVSSLVASIIFLSLAFASSSSFS